MAPLRIEVTGESTIYRAAERAIVSVTIQSEGPSQEEVAGNVTSTSAQLRDMLESLAPKDATGQPVPDAPVSKWSNSNLSTSSHLNYHSDGDKQPRVYSARTSYQVRFQDFNRLGSFASTLSMLEHVSIDNIDWRLTDKTKESLSSQSRHQAVLDAVKKGGDFAAALGISNLPVTEIRDQGNHSSSVYAMRAAPKKKMMVAASGGDDLSFEPEDVALHCTIGVVFERKE